ncbi:putative galacturonosyltransferase 14 [Capsicum baccatum]|uniref:Hexosyltransferase n=1 Tax=Capsicum baccatum TaxID=33114 RepID=A0A2G2V8B6_CAPBA|nr:putative galacturonosyltransferase 14 [Capsicum baccatum]
MTPANTDTRGTTLPCKNGRENLNSGFELQNPGALPPSLIVLKGYVHRIDPLWNIAGLGYRSIINVIESILEDGAVIHFSGLSKPWLEIGALEM